MSTALMEAPQKEAQAGFFKPSSAEQLNSFQLDLVNKEAGMSIDCGGCLPPRCENGRMEQPRHTWDLS